ncbi:esterase [Lysobacter enzymogenes]|uniref:Esterase n=1 Tax=Lysobacter enzymogenes TaxID=69 RepID=A0A0S2DBJ0_LYSEN|nr:alpha/beta hydrolase-fold protein [Lysobacter enzymogenes]ALN55909.1 esterase [Lysobacter enzymogenes]
MKIHRRGARAALLSLAVACACAVGPACAQAPAQTAPAAPTAPTAPAAAKLYDSFTLDSKILGETRRINVYAPPAYAARGRDRHPVLYMPDGGLQEDFPHVADAVDRAIADGAIAPMFVVGIENTQRKRDMTGPTEVAEELKLAPTLGGSAQFRAFIRDELIPQVERRLRTDARRGIVGESLAGLFVAETFLREPRLFDVYIAISPSLWWNRDALLTQAPALLRENLKALPRRTLRLYSADEDNIAPQTQRLADLLRAQAPAGLTWGYWPRPDLTHGTIYRAVEDESIRAAFAAPARAPRK